MFATVPSPTMALEGAARGLRGRTVMNGTTPPQGTAEAERDRDLTAGGAPEAPDRRDRLTARRASWRIRGLAAAAIVGLVLAGTTLIGADDPPHHPLPARSIGLPQADRALVSRFANRVSTVDGAANEADRALRDRFASRTADRDASMSAADRALRDRFRAG